MSKHEHYIRMDKDDLIFYIDEMSELKSRLSLMIKEMIDLDRKIELHYRKKYGGIRHIFRKTHLINNARFDFKAQAYKKKLTVYEASHSTERARDIVTTDSSIFYIHHVLRDHYESLRVLGSTHRIAKYVYIDFELMETFDYIDEKEEMIAEFREKIEEYRSLACEILGCEVGDFGCA